MVVRELSVRADRIKRQNRHWADDTGSSILAVCRAGRTLNPFAQSRHIRICPSSAGELAESVWHAWVKSVKEEWHIGEKSPATFRR